ncbi:hypothetical protein BDZ97DRAFT_1054157 [Flammula alnicola]|nr:hypothetical protein BDZ97DRAFT_1054157 [Flammula alnicola]
MKRGSGVERRGFEGESHWTRFLFLEVDRRKISYSLTEHSPDIFRKTKAIRNERDKAGNWRHPRTSIVHPRSPVDNNPFLHIRLSKSEDKVRGSAAEVGRRHSLDKEGRDELCCSYIQFQMLDMGSFRQDVRNRTHPRIVKNKFEEIIVFAVPTHRILGCRADISGGSMARESYK